MKETLFTITISRDTDKHMLVPEIEITEAGKRYSKREKVEMVDQCIQVILKQLRGAAE